MSYTEPAARLCVCRTWYLLQALFGCLAVDQLSLGGAETGVGWGHRGAIVFWERPAGGKNNKKENPGIYLHEQK